mmetsp:Transcript_39416/g.122907  ORF Transcript_39416/g.122907 Transcript_39416/m.122907 type:complete len:163 (-) Transcript_39416:36-524(-)
MFVAHRVSKEYVCLCGGWMAVSPKALRAPLRTVLEAGGRRTSAISEAGRRSRTDVRGVVHLLEGGERCSLAAVALQTGRLHQIRAHLGGEGHPLVGDAEYGPAGPARCSRVFLHAWRLRIGTDSGPTGAECGLPADLRDCLSGLQPADGRAGASLLGWLRGS